MAALAWPTCPRLGASRPGVAEGCRPASTRRRRHIAARLHRRVIRGADGAVSKAAGRDQRSGLPGNEHRKDGTSGEPPQGADAHVAASGSATRVIRLELGQSATEGGRAVVYLVGVSHVLTAAASREVRALMRRCRPDAVVLELCPERANTAMAAAVAASASASSSSSRRGEGRGDGRRQERESSRRPSRSETGPGVVPASVRVLGLPPKRPLPGASPAELLGSLCTVTGSVASVDDLRRDCDTLLATGLFGDVTVDVDDDGCSGEHSVVYCVGCSGGEEDEEGLPTVPPLREVIDGVSVTFRVAPNPEARVDGAVKFSWGRAALAALGGEAAREEVEAEVIRGAVRLLLAGEGKECKAEEEVEVTGDAVQITGRREDADGEGQYEKQDDDEQEEDWEGVALHAALRESARQMCADICHTAGVEINVTSSRCTGGRDEMEEEDGVTWVSASVNGELKFPDIEPLLPEPKGNRAAGDDETIREQKRSTGASFLDRIVRAAAASATIPGPARAYFAASDIAQELIAWRLRENGKRNVAGNVEVGDEPAGYEMVSALSAALEVGTSRVVLGDVRVSTTAAAVEAAIAAQTGPFPGLRLAAATLADAFRLVLFTGAETLEDKITAAISSSFSHNGKGGALARETIVPWLMDPLINSRDDQISEAIRWTAGSVGGGTAKVDRTPAGEGLPAYVRTDVLGSPCCGREDRGERWQCYEYAAAAAVEKAGEGDRVSSHTATVPIVVAVVGAAHIDGIVSRLQPGGDQIKSSGVEI